ncbi:MAG: nickel-binding protein [Nitrososphaeraceae archaeon]
MPAFLDFHSMGRYNEDDLKKSLKEPRNELEVKVLNTFYDLDSGMMFCLVDAPDRYAVERHHSKYGMKCDWITPIKMTSGYDNSDQE